MTLYNESHQARAAGVGGVSEEYTTCARYSSSCRPFFDKIAFADFAGRYTRVPKLLLEGRHGVSAQQNE